MISRRFEYTQGNRIVYRECITKGSTFIHKWGTDDKAINETRCEYTTSEEAFNACTTIVLDLLAKGFIELNNKESQSKTFFNSEYKYLLKSLTWFNFFVSSTCFNFTL